LSERLREEKLALGYHLSGHLFDAYSADARALGTTPLVDLKPMGGKRFNTTSSGSNTGSSTGNTAHSNMARNDPWVAGIVRTIRTQMGKKGKMAYITLDDGTATTEIAVFNDTFNTAQALLVTDTFVAIQVRVIPTDNGGLRVSAAQVVNEDGLWLQRCGQVHLTFTPQVGRSIYSLIKSQLGTEGATLKITAQQAGSIGDIVLYDNYLKANATNIAALRQHPQIAKLSFSIGETKTAPLQHNHDDYDMPDEDVDFNNDSNHNHHPDDAPAHDTEYDYV
jgi:DNA polymerase III alpha subunit